MICEPNTVRGDEVSAVTQIEQLSVAGPPEVIKMMMPNQMTPETPSDNVSSGSGDDGGCLQANRGTGSDVMLWIVLLIGLRWRQARSA